MGRALPRRLPAYQEQPEDESSLLGKIGSGTLSGLAKVANVLDLPGSSLRDIGQSFLTGSFVNPFDQWLSPTQPTNRTRGRQLLESLGVQKNKETGVAGWADDPLEGVRDLGGFGMELLFDPFFTAPKATIGGIKAVGSALGAPKAISALRWGKVPGTNFSPGQHAARIFSPKAQELHTPEVGKFAEDLFDQKELIHRGVREETAIKASEMARRGVMDDEAAMLGRLQAEGVILDRAKLSPEQATKADVMREILDSYKTPAGKGDSLPELYEQARHFGIKVNEFSDPAGIQYFPREFVEMLSASVSRLPREQYLRGLTEGTEQFRKLIADPKILEGSHDDAVRYFWEKYGEDFKSFYPESAIQMQRQAPVPQVTNPAQAQAIRERQSLADELVHRVRNAYTPEQRAVGGFGRNPLADVQDAKIGMQIGIAKNAAAIEALSHFAKPYRAYDEAAGAGQRVGEILARMGVDEVVEGIAKPGFGSSTPGASQVKGGALVSLARKLGMDTDDAGLQVVRDMIVPERLADDIVRLAKPFDAPAMAGPIQKMYNSATNLFKSFVLTWPARYVRDLVSGQTMNMVTGNWSGKAAKRMHNLLAGKVEDFTDVPAVRQLLESQGLPKTAENSTEAMRQLMYADEIHTAVAGQQGIGEVAGDISGMLPGQTKEFAGEFVGRDPLNPFSPSTLNAGDSLNPFAVRGFGDRTKSTFKPVAIGERIGRYTDSMNRGVAYLTNLQRGIDPKKAAEIAKGLQVNYAPRMFTQTERAYFKKAFPFYSFTSRMVPAIAKEIVKKPGGGLAQAFRAQNLATGDPDMTMPEYLQQTTTIPIGELPDGSQRYLGSLGQMWEPALQLLGGDSQDKLERVGSQLNPLPKSLIEWGTGRSLFRSGEDLEDLDPTIGRTLANLGLGEEDASGRAKPFLGSPLLEHALANSPLSRGFSTARTISDPRKRSGDLGPIPLAANVLSGFKFTDVSPSQQDAILRDQMSEIAKEELGARDFTRVSIPKEVIEAAEKAGDSETAERMRAFNRINNLLASRAKKRKKEQK